MKNLFNVFRSAAVVLSMSISSLSPAATQVSIGVSMPGVSIGINMPAYPQFVRVPNYPVYYAPGLQTNFFFYDGLYWVYQQDNWYSSSWYNGPWWQVGPEAVPLFVLRIPVRYYRNPPTYFRGWRPDAPPRWGEHWGNQWSQQRSGWDRWDRRAAPAPAPLPVYQRQYGGNRYPQVEQQQALQSRNYRYQPRDDVVRQHYQQQVGPHAGAPTQRGQQAAPGRAPAQDRPAGQSRPQQGADRREPQQPPGAYDKGAPAGRSASPRPEQGQGQAQGQGKGNTKAKGQDKDRDDADESGARHARSSPARRSALRAKHRPAATSSRPVRDPRDPGIRLASATRRLGGTV